jgi:hypothetical protein
MLLILDKASDLADYNQHGDENSLSIKDGKFLENLNDYYLLKKDPAVRS